MEIFVSWSGGLSHDVANVLKQRIPCIIQSTNVFFSSEDIEKGSNWDQVISTELSKCNFGIICLTSENVSAPWIQFEAGAIAKTLDSKVSALMVDVKPSDIKGPLSRYQATRLEKEDFKQLIQSINSSLDDPLDERILENTFNAIWPSMFEEISKVITDFKKSNKENKKSIQSENEPIEEVLQLLRKQNSILTNPEMLIPMEYLKYIQSNMSEGNSTNSNITRRLAESLVDYVCEVFPRIQMHLAPCDPSVVDLFALDTLSRMICRYTKGAVGERLSDRIRHLDDQMRSEDSWQRGYRAT